MEQMYVCLFVCPSMYTFTMCSGFCISPPVLEEWYLNFVGLSNPLLLFLLCWQVNFLNTDIKGPNNTRKFTNHHLILYLL